MLKSFVSVYVPSTKNVNIPLLPEEKRAADSSCARKLSSAFGGCTARQGIGYWISDNGELIEESVTIITAYTDNPDALTIAHKIALDIKRELAQEAVTIESNEGLEFI